MPLSARAPHSTLAATALLAVGGLVAATTAGITGGPAAASPRVSLVRAASTGPDAFSEALTGLADLDTRTSIAPTAAQRGAVPSGVSVRWNRYGTPSSVINQTGWLSSARGGSAVAAARAWLGSHTTLLGLSAGQVSGLALLNDSTLTASKAHVVRFRESFGPAVPALDGMVTLALAPDNKIAYVSSSLSRTTSAAPAATLTPLKAWSLAVSELRAKQAPSVPAPDLSGVTPTQTDGWTTFTVPGFAQTQQVRLRTLAMPGAAPRPVFETNVVNSAGGSAAAYTSFVDAVNGKILVRHNRTDNFSTAAVPATNTSQPFQGTVTATTCGPDHDYTVDDATRSIVVAASTVAPDEDITLALLHDGKVVATSDTATSPEGIAYSTPTTGAGGTYTVRVCPYPDPTAPIVVGQYAGEFVASEQAVPSTPSTYPPEWKYFASNPTLNFSPTATPTNRLVACWTKAAGCTVPPTPLQNTAARAPWDVDPRSGLSTNTTMGNAAITSEAWLSPLTPGGLRQMPVSLNRHYGFDNGPTQEFTDAWNNTKCSPSAFTPVNNNNDILATVTNLFSGHNRFHDFAYYLGFTEDNYNLQSSNFGNDAQGGTVPGGGANDPELGNVQAGALSGGAPSYLGRDNANQIALQDGIPGITNQYLFQPIAAAFYSPCVDGDLDAPVYGHEYTHAISNRMVAGPDDGLTGFQAGSMGESWSDQVALEYLFEHSYPSGTSDPWVEGAYATGNRTTGIRNYTLDKNPLQYGDLGYDTTGPEVHADGEVWSAVSFNVRRKLVAKYNAAFPESDKALQLRCADATTPRSPLPPEQCPGGRRWIQLIFDSFLMQESATSMVDARDAYLAADKIRFGGRDLKDIWDGFAQTGLGANASTASTEDDQPVSDYTSPFEPEGRLSINAQAFGGATPRTPVKGQLFIGDYQGRVTPIADTDPGTSLPSSVSMVPGTYHVVFAAPGYGLHRYTWTVTAGQTNAQQIHLTSNLASVSSGASVDGASAGSLNADKLLDDSEASNWAGVNPSGVSVDTAAAHPFVNVRLAGNGSPEPVRSVRVSAMLRPADPAQDDDPNQPDADSGSRFTALRQFAIETCTESASSDCSSTLASDAPGSPYTRVYTSPANAFNGVAPRPVAPALLEKTFDIPDTTATHVRLVALENQCTGQAQFASEQDADPLNDTDCKSASTADESVRAAELEVFGYDGDSRPPGDPVVTMTMTGPATAAPGDTVTYTLSYRNLGPKPSSSADVRVPELPAGLQFVSASNGGTYDPGTRALRWALGTVPVGATGSLTLTTRVAADATVGTTLLTQAQFAGTATSSPPAAAITVVTP